MPITPTNNPTMIRAKWDAEVAEALKKGKRYDSVNELLKDIC